MMDHGWVLRRVLVQGCVVVTLSPGGLSPLWVETTVSGCLACAVIRKRVGEGFGLKVEKKRRMRKEKMKKQAESPNLWN